MRLPLTPFQTVGPFFAIGLRELYRTDLSGDVPGAEAVRLHGRVLDGHGAPVVDAVVETWQAGPDGGYGADSGGPSGAAGDDGDARGSSGLAGFGRCATDADGRFAFTTWIPGAVAHPDGGLQAPHIAVSIVMRGILHRLVTRVYFEGQPLNDADPVLASVPAARHGTLLARRDDAGSWTWDVRLQGEAETVFFEL